MKHLQLLLFLVAAHSATAQDVHFSQFFVSPVVANPANAGHFSATYRLSAFARQQWPAVSASPYESALASAEVSRPLGLKWLGAGLIAVADRAGASAFSTIEVGLPLSLTARIGSRRQWHAAVGAQVGFRQTSIDYSRLSFGSQFTGNRYVPTAPTGEASGSSSFINPSLAAGINLGWKGARRAQVNAGYAQFNANEPAYSFASQSDKLPKRQSVQASAILRLAETWDLAPAARWMNQQPHTEWILGTAVVKHLSVDQKSAQLGLWSRLSDAAALTVGYQQANLYVGASYDFNLSTLQVASLYRGGWELALVYTIATVREKVKRLRTCPNYL